MNQAWTDRASIPNWVRYLASAGRCAPSADNAQPWNFVFDGESLRLKFNATRGGELGSDHPVVLMAFGAVMENLVQAAEAAGMDTCDWLFYPPFPGQTEFLRIPAPSKDVDSVEVADFLCDRHTNRSAFSKEPLPLEVISAITEKMQDNLHIRWFGDQAAIRQVAQLVRLASELRFQIEEIHRWLAKSLRFTEAEIALGDGLDVDTLNLPPGGKLLLRFLADWRRMAFLNRLGAYKFLASVEAAQFTQAGGVVAILGQDRGNESWLSAGRLLERSWLFLNAHGQSVHPYFVLADQLHRLRSDRLPPSLRPQAERLAQMTRDVFRSSEETLFMLYRVGKATTPAKRSRRLSIETILA